MRIAVLRIYPDESFHPAEQAITAEDSVERVAIRQFNQLSDGTVVLLYALRGDADVVREALEGYDDILQYTVSQTGSEVHAYIQFKPTDTAAHVLDIPQQFRFIIDTPIECLPDGSFRLSAIGEPAVFTAALERLGEAVNVELESMQAYEPVDQQLYSTLTERQQEILHTAIAAGYYEVPREATYDDIADELDLSAVTVGEHLRKIEAQILTEITPEIQKRQPRD